MMRSKTPRAKNGRKSHGADSDDIVEPKKVTGKELDRMDELSAHVTTLVELLDEKGVINKNEYSRLVAMRLHELSKAGAFEELDEEI